MYKGYYSRHKHSGVYGAFPGGDVSYPTVSPVREEQDALDVLAHLFMREVATDAAEAASTDFIIAATSHSAQRGDIIRVTSGTHSGREVKVIYVTTNAIYISDKIALANTDTFQILRHKAPLVQADGTVVTSAVITPSPIQYVRNGVDTEVEEDSGTPANSRPLPIKVLNGSGAEVALATSAKQDTIIGHVDGIESLLSTIDGRVDGIEALLTSLDGKDYATQTTLAALSAKFGSLGQKAMAGSAPVVIASDQSTLPVSAASLPLPTGAATSAKQDTIIGHVDGIESLLSTIDGRVDGLEALLTSVDGKLPPTLGQKAMAASLAVVLASDQSSIPVAATQSGNWSVRNQDGSGNALTSEASGSNRAIHTKPRGGIFADSARQDYSGGSVTTGAWTQLIASTAAECQGLTIFDSSGQTMELGIGAAASETRTLLIPPGGLNGFIPLRIPASTRVSVRAVSATASVGELNLNLIQ